mmetsp:Transcript_105280/g.293092  ORF Transcript_105280/g.293092 Transcript_105280/m.293092 type:complete len:246 (+) Transcript_105280:1203-1940(+)
MPARAHACGQRAARRGHSHVARAREGGGHQGLQLGNGLCLRARERHDLVHARLQRRHLRSQLFHRRRCFLRRRATITAVAPGRHRAGALADHALAGLALGEHRDCAGHGAGDGRTRRGPHGLIVGLDEHLEALVVLATAHLLQAEVDCGLWLIGAECDGLELVAQQVEDRLVALLHALAALVMQRAPQLKRPAGAERLNGQPHARGQVVALAALIFEEHILGLVGDLQRRLCSTASTGACATTCR